VDEGDQHTAVPAGLFSPEVDLALRDAGWRPGRRAFAVEFWIDHFEEQECPPTDAAVDFLVEFGGLDVLISGMGITRAREPFDLDPVLCSGNVDRFIDWGQEIGRSLFPIGVLGPYRQCLGIDEFSEIYLIETQIASFGRMPDAMEALVLGRMPVRLDADPS
jgi:hypothetical protein